MKTLGMIWFILFLVTTFVYMIFDGYTNVTKCSLGITILCYLFYLGAKLEEKIDKLIDELDKKK
jgi:Ca2+/Na+ antiporter